MEAWFLASARVKSATLYIQKHNGGNEKCTISVESIISNSLIISIPNIGEQ
jgi:hypothetical protein